MLKKNFGFFQAILVSSAVFSISHWIFFGQNIFNGSWAWFIITFFVGFVLSYLYVYFDSIWAGLFFRLIWELLLIMIYNIGIVKIWGVDRLLNSYDLLAVITMGVLFVFIVGFGIVKYYDLSKYREVEF